MTCDLFCINQPFPTNFSFEKTSCIDFELSLLIDYTSYHYENFSVANTEQDLYRNYVHQRLYGLFAAFCDSFYSNPETRVANLSIATGVGERGEGGVWTKHWLL